MKVVDFPSRLLAFCGEGVSHLLHQSAVEDDNKIRKKTTIFKKTPFRKNTIQKKGTVSHIY
jgi:hypothetical protein